MKSVFRTDTLSSVAGQLRFVVDEFATGGPMSAEAGLRYNGVTQRMTDLSASVDTPLLSINQTVEVGHASLVSYNDFEVNAKIIFIILKSISQKKKK